MLVCFASSHCSRTYRLSARRFASPVSGSVVASTESWVFSFLRTPFVRIACDWSIALARVAKSWAASTSAFVQALKQFRTVSRQTSNEFRGVRRPCWFCPFAVRVARPFDLNDLLGSEPHEPHLMFAVYCY